MPELPEVETVRIGLQKLLVGKTVHAVDFNWPKSFPNSEQQVQAFLIGAKITQVRRRAKVLLIDLSTNYSMVVHLKMTGQIVFVPTEQKQEGLGTRNLDNLKSNTLVSNTHTPNPTAESRFGAGHPNDSLIGDLPDKSTRVTLTFTDASKLFFNDQRKFGWIKIVPTQLLNQTLTGAVLEPSTRQERSAQSAVQVVPRLSTGDSNDVIGQELSYPSKLVLLDDESGTASVIDFMKKVGPEPLEPEFTKEVFVERLQRRKNTSIKAAILDQTVLAGIGNIYADESLFIAGIHPKSIVGAVPKKSLVLLHTAIIYVLKLSIEKGGSTDRNYVNAEGKKGSYISFAKVFRKENQPCPNACGSIIEKIRVAGRGTHVCNRCQIIYEKQ
jgi:formamidopyrimidine-DNA glycosylase